MHRLEITGATPEDLFMNAVRMLSVLLKGGAQTVPVDPPGDTALAGGSASSVAHEAETGSNPVGADQSATPGLDKVMSKPRRGRAATKAATADLNDDISDVGGAPTGQTIEHDAREINGKPAELTLDGDIRPRLRAIQAAHEKRGNDMKACVAYLLKLYGPFGITKADQLKPEQFAEFMEASEGYLNGEA